MIRRYIATALLIFFFSYAAYLIVTDGGKNEIITFEKLNNNIHEKFKILTGQETSKKTPFEENKQRELNELKLRTGSAPEKLESS